MNSPSSGQHSATIRLVKIALLSIISNMANRILHALQLSDAVPASMANTVPEHVDV
jgi:hypothetical protein